MSVIVRDLDAGSVAVSSSSEGDLRFRARSGAGEAFALELQLREDIVVGSVRFEVAPRPDKLGALVVVSATKRHAHRWDRLVVNPKRFGSLMDKDWSREDKTLEAEEELPYVEEHASVLLPFSSGSLRKHMAKSKVVANVRYPWCSVCKHEDEVFAKAAKLARLRGKRDASWRNLMFGVVDAREERMLARDLGADCDQNCGYKVFAGPEEEPVDVKARLREEELLADLAKFLAPAVRVLEVAADLEPLRAANTTCFAAFASAAGPRYAAFRRTAGRLRGELVFVASFGEERAPQLWPWRSDSPYTYSGSLDDNGTEFLAWVRPRAVPPLQAWAPHLRETYERLGLPLAMVWINGDDESASLAPAVRDVLGRLAAQFVGRLAFVEKHTTGHYAWAELREYGLNAPEVYPAFGIASNASDNSIKYGFEVTGLVAPSVQQFWADAEGAALHVGSFCEDVLAGRWPEAHPTGIPQTNWTLGMAKRITWRTYGELRRPERPLLLELLSRHRADHGWKLQATAQLARALASEAPGITVAMYDTADNYLPPGDFPRGRHSLETEWYYVAQERPPAKLSTSKSEVPMRAVVKFLKAQAKLPLLDVSKVMASYEELLAGDAAGRHARRHEERVEAELAKWRGEGRATEL